MSTPVDAEQAWKDLQRIRIPQERVYDEVERSAESGPGGTYAVAAIMWVFLVGISLDLPRWGLWLAMGAYVALLSVLAVVLNRRSRMRLHRSRYDWRATVLFFGGAVVTGGTVLLSGHLVESLEPMTGGLIRATASAAVFVLVSGPVNRWAVGSLRDRAARAEEGR
ncbi:hypothetical protein GCM10010145_28390 [Streptomyces ruber]|uniref:Uncharacterized protein n=2 Tax=Streptomyces TaxID=1883 RepID=A0A918EQM5_9ACTN|nr:hypothetical protein [Streptomyces ruber]GGQ56647.1 hypothetical protein GCM10010145_28390 [Streptomyces ruber]